MRQFYHLSDKLISRLGLLFFLFILSMGSEDFHFKLRNRFIFPPKIVFENIFDFPSLFGMNHDLTFFSMRQLAENYKFIGDRKVYEEVEYSPVFFGPSTRSNIVSRFLDRRQRKKQKPDPNNRTT